MLQFQNIEFLLGLLALIPLTLLFLFVLRWKQKTRKALGDERLIVQLTQNYSPKLYRIKIIAVLAAIALGIVSFANLRKPKNADGTKGSGIDVMFALDVSKSMLSQDEKPTRLDKAKQLISTLSEKLEGNKVGLIVFAGKSYLQMPLTSDMAAAKMFVSNASTDLVDVQGTVVSEALDLSDASLDTKERKSKAVVLITDGEDHDAKAADAIKKLADHGTVVYTVGVGSPEGSPIIEPGTTEYKRDMNGQTVITKLNDKLLKELAIASKGSYHHLTNTSSTADALMDELNGMEKKPINSAGGFIEYQSFYSYFLAFAVLLLLIEVFVPERKMKLKLA
jgi:Ca-activated chloride channel family protein